ncbi:MAG: ABC transporter substrate-binding protein [Nitrospirae bacterium]|nr:ABC transporter substrate-binding protein [Nitrospirota bacterium]MBF0535601.1 ABC transporter substrate-binding protein [Nitrospirota bacterium]MBF0617484.1 ABC transporter substrate-binding protein [Nitrospirota bacterium]
MKVVFALIVVVFLLESAAVAESPDELLKVVIDKIYTVLKDKALKSTEKTQERRKHIRSIIESRFDFEEMSKRSLAVYWQKRTDAEKKEFTSLFENLLENVYITKIESYSGEEVLFVEQSIDGDYSTVKTVIMRKAQKIPMDYKLMKINNEWKVYDVVIEGISLVNNYRTQFTRILGSGSYEGLVKTLKEKIASNESRTQ